VLQPTPENLGGLNRRLEVLAGSIASIQSAVLAGEYLDRSAKEFLVRVQAEMPRIQRLLDSSANVFNSIAKRRDSSHSAYARDGLLRTTTGSARLLAQL
jgi:hypothetical protein